MSMLPPVRVPTVADAPELSPVIVSPDANATALIKT